MAVNNCYIKEDEKRTCTNFSHLPAVLFAQDSTLVRIPVMVSTLIMVFFITFPNIGDGQGPTTSEPEICLQSVDTR